jgi:biotin carboxylase
MLEALALFDDGGGAPEEMVIEEYLRGTEDLTGSGFADYVSVESIVSHGVVSHLALTGCFPMAEPFRETGIFVPSDLSEPLRSEVLDVTTHGIRALGIETGCVHTEVKLTPEGPRLIEVNGRVGGSRPGVVASVSDVSLLQLALRLAVGEHVVFEKPLECRGVGFLFWVQSPAWATQLTGIKGLEELQGVPGVESITLNRKVGEAVSWRDGTQGYVFVVHGHLDTTEEVRDLFAHVHEKVQLSFT